MLPIGRRCVRHPVDHKTIQQLMVLWILTILAWLNRRLDRSASYRSLWFRKPLQRLCSKLLKSSKGVTLHLYITSHVVTTLQSNTTSATELCWPRMPFCKGAGSKEGSASDQLLGRRLLQHGTSCRQVTNLRSERLNFVAFKTVYNSVDCVSIVSSATSSTKMSQEGGGRKRRVIKAKSRGRTTLYLKLDSERPWRRRVLRSIGTSTLATYFRASPERERLFLALVVETLQCLHQCWHLQYHHLLYIYNFVKAALHCTLLLWEVWSAQRCEL
jgi:hypothetical protein